MANQRNGQGYQPQVVYVQQAPQKPQSHGCLVTAIAFLLFGWIGVAAVALWKLTKLAWRASWACVVYPVRWTVGGSRWLTAHYGWRGWAFVGGAVVVLAIFGSILQAVGATH